MALLLATTACPARPPPECVPAPRVDAGVMITCPGTPPACGTVTTDAGTVECGDCPYGLACGAVSPGLCGGIVCTKDGSVVRVTHVPMEWNGRNFASPVQPFGRVNFFLTYDDADISVQVTSEPNRSFFVRQNRVSTNNDVVTVLLDVSQGGGSGSVPSTTRCEGSATYSVKRPWAP